MVNDPEDTEILYISSMESFPYVNCSFPDFHTSTRTMSPQSARVGESLSQASVANIESFVDCVLLPQEGYGMSDDTIYIHGIVCR